MTGSSENELADVLSRTGKPLERQNLSDGSRLLILPYGARVLGLFAPGSEENFFWTHPALASEPSARAYFQSTDWHNTGGDRTWLAPEVDIFFPDYPETKVWQVPTELDPGAYEAVQPGPTLKLASDVKATLSRSGEKVAARITKHWSPAPNPLRHESGWKELDGLAYAGYTQETCLDLLAGGGKSARVGLWDLLAVPPGGEVIIPTHGRTEPEVYTGSIPPSNLRITDHLVRFQTPGTGIRKIGIRACASTGRLGYLYPCLDAWALIVCNFTVDPSGEYIDVPWSRSTAGDAMGFSTQACAVQAGDWDYCELEHHVPAISLATGRSRSVDTSQVWAFRGPQSAIGKVAKSLLLAEL
jgi:hypothetical protein